MPNPLIHKYPPLLMGTLIKRYQRFLADVEVRGKRITAFCPNSGSMLGLALPGSRAALSLCPPSSTRRTTHTLELLKPTGLNHWVAVNTHLTNHLAARLIQRGLALPGYTIERAEATLGDSRFDFLLNSPDGQPAYLEVKSVTLQLGNNAAFPDSITTRGQKHLRALTRIAKKGNTQALAMYIVQRPDCDCLRAAHEIDPDYAVALKAAIRAGVQVMAIALKPSPKEIRVLGGMPLCTVSDKR